jgi:hypothetical protein
VRIASPRGPAPSRFGIALGWFLLALSLVSFTAFVATALVPTVLLRVRFALFGFGFALLAVVPTLLFAFDPRLLGGQLGWYLRANHWVGQQPRTAGLALAWMGICVSVVGWAPALFPALLRQDATPWWATAVLVLAATAPAFALAWRFGRRRMSR